MKMNKILSVLAAAAAVALSASAQDSTSYIPLTVSGTVTVGYSTVNKAGTKTTYTSKATAINNKGVLALLHSWYTNDGNTDISSFTTSGYKLAVLWDYTQEQPLTTGGVTNSYGEGNVVVLDKSGKLVYDPTAVGNYDFYVYGNWIKPTIISGNTAIISGGTNIFDDTLGAGTVNYSYQGGFGIYDQSTAGATSISQADLWGDGKGTGTATFSKVGLETKIGFKFNTFGSPLQFQDGVTSTGTETAAIALTFTSGTVIAASSGTSPTGNVPF